VTPAARIRILPEETVNRVAAGEVVERPAAALKELIENSIDAGAANLAVDLERAGKGLIRVVDDGAGMSHDDLLLALERHATSKILAVEDLSRVATFGFRGEALPSIAAVSRLRIESRARGAGEGTRLVADGGRIVRVEPCGCPEGTAIEARDLFHTVPARLKFLRSDATELGHCLQVASRLALACPQLGVTVRHGGRELLRLAPAADAGARLRGYLDREFVSGLLPVRGSSGPLAVSGFVSRPGAGRPGADYQQLFVNARPVRDAVVAQELRETFRDLFRQDPAGCSYFLWISIPPEAVDVNVHPTKREVRFRDPGAVRSLVAEGVREALRLDRSAAIPTAAFQPSGASAPRVTFPALGTSAAPPAAPLPAEVREAGGYAAMSQPPLPLPAEERGRPAVAAANQLFGTYLVCVEPGGLVLVDQHAAHERILYERFLARAAGGLSQRMLEPLLIELTPAEESAAETARPVLESLGVSLEPFGPRSWRVVSLPPELDAAAAAPFIRESLAAALEGGAAPRVEEFRHRAAALLACHAAIRANRRLAPDETAALIADLARTGNPGACPHGRPTSITIDRAEIERRFKRT